MTFAYLRPGRHSISAGYDGDANEYNALRLFPGWTGEGVDGYVLPTAATGTTALYRLNLSGGNVNLHLWSVHQNEYDYLGSHGWTKEGIAAYVITIAPTPLPAVSSLGALPGGSTVAVTDLKVRAINISTEADQSFLREELAMVG